MKFCTSCCSRMQKNTDTGSIQFKCICGKVVGGNESDSLMFEEFLEAKESNLKHEVFISNSSSDPAANRVAQTCPQCKLDFMTMIRIGTQETTMYTCSCGYRVTHTDYIKQ